MLCLTGESDECVCMCNSDTVILGLTTWYLSKTESCSSLTRLLGWDEGAVKQWQVTAGCVCTLHSDSLECLVCNEFKVCFQELSRNALPSISHPVHWLHGSNDKL